MSTECLQKCGKVNSSSQVNILVAFKNVSGGQWLFNFAIIQSCFILELLKQGMLSLFFQPAATENCVLYIYLTDVNHDFFVQCYICVFCFTVQCCLCTVLCKRDLVGILSCTEMLY